VAVHESGTIHTELVAHFFDVPLVSASLFFAQMHDVQDLLGLPQTLGLEFFLDLLVFQEVDPLVQGVPGDVVELVDLEQVVFRIELMGIPLAEEFLLSVVQLELIVVMQAQELRPAVIDVVFSLSQIEVSECRRARDAKRDIPVPLSPCARATTCTCRGRPAPGPRLRHFAPPPDPYDEWLDGVSDALASGLRQLRDLRPLRHFGQPLAPTPTADYPPRASRFPGGQRSKTIELFLSITL